MNRPLTYEEIAHITQTFYSQFCGIDLTAVSSGTHFVCTPEREQIMKGFGCRFTVYILAREGLCAAAYAPRYAAAFESWKGLEASEWIQAARERFPLKEQRLMVFRRETIGDFRAARPLFPEDYPLFEAFYRAAYPKANLEDGWLEEFFTEKAALGRMTGYEAGGRLTCVCDAPDMPYMADAIQHTGIYTLAGERRKGFAACTAALAARQLIRQGICPQWECSASNEASFALAQKVGYEPYGMAYILEE